MTISIRLTGARDMLGHSISKVVNRLIHGVHEETSLTESIVAFALVLLAILFVTAILVYLITSVDAFRMPQRSW
jgi:small neutral amino acid transporter SnatA (MarC family)